MKESTELFAKKNIAGVFKGFTEGGLEFHADLVLPYKSDFQSSPMHGQFILVQLETPEEAVLGRIASFSAEGKLSYGAGEEFNIRAMEEGRPVPEELRENYLRYKVNIRVLGVLRHGEDGLLGFVPSLRRLPHVGSPVAFPSGEVLRELAGHNLPAASEVGHFALGEYIYCGDNLEGLDDWVQPKQPEVLVKFSIDKLVSRRSFIFARAGFGKSNLTKLLFSTLYEHTPTVEKRAGKQVPVGTVIFDPDGEYFWPDDKGRPGLCDVPHLEDKVVVFTNRKSSSKFYQSFVAGGVKLDIRFLPPHDIIGIALSPEKQDQQNVRKLRGLGFDNWHRLVDLIYQDKNQTDLEAISEILGLESDRQQAEALAARANMTTVVTMLHDPSSRLIDHLIKSLRNGKLCVVDISQMRGTQGMILAGIIMRRIFDHNQEQFTEAEPSTIPTIVVVEEAQSVLDEHSSASEPFIAWVKEGRKYDLGAVMITQQPGSISGDILSQGDNWFVFHLLSATDLITLKRANAHFSDDLLGALLNEPIVGHCVFWSSVGGKAYPLSTKILSFEARVKTKDPGYSMGRGNTYAAMLKDSSIAADSANSGAPKAVPIEVHVDDEGTEQAEQPSKAVESNDRLAEYIQRFSAIFSADAAFMGKLESSDGLAYGTVKANIKKQLPPDTHDLDKLAYQLVSGVLSAICGGPQGWQTIKRRNQQGRWISYVIRS